MKKHAKRFGPDGILTTAAELYHAGRFTYSDVRETMAALDEQEKAEKGAWAKKHRKTLRQRTDELLGIQPDEAA